MSAYAQIARRYRSMGADRDQVMAALGEQGLTPEDAARVIDEVDAELTQTGPMASTGATAVATAPAPVRQTNSLHFAGVERSDSDQLEAARQHRLRVDVAFAELRSSGDDAQARAKVIAEGAAEADLDAVMAEASQRYERVQARERRALERAERAKHERPVQHAQKSGSNWGVVWIVLGIALCIMGLAVGRIQSLLIGGITIAQGVKQLND